MANRNVFNFLAALGPAGSIAIFVEKICRIAYHEGYAQQDPDLEQTQELDNKAKEQRKLFVEELFEKRGRLQKELLSLSESTQDAAYDEITRIILRYKAIVTKIQQSKLARQRLFYQPNSLQYKRLLEQSKKIEGDTIDNLSKMAIQIMDNQAGGAKNSIVDAKKLASKITEKTGYVGFDTEQGTVDQRISFNRAQQLLAKWKELVKEYAQQGNDLQQLKLELEKEKGEHESSMVLAPLKDKLFVEMEEDPIDTWEAFHYYNLSPLITNAELIALKALQNTPRGSATE